MRNNLPAAFSFVIRFGVRHSSFKISTQDLGQTIPLHVPALPVSPSHKLIGLFHIGDLHLLAIPQQLPATIVIHLIFCVFFSQHVTSDRQVAHQHGFGHRPGVVKRRSQSFMLFASKACLTCIDPFPLVTIFWLIVRAGFRTELCCAIVQVKLGHQR